VTQVLLPGRPVGFGCTLCKHVRHSTAMRQRGYVTGLVALLWVASCAHVPNGPEEPTCAGHLTGGARRGAFSSRAGRCTCWTLSREDHVATILSPAGSIRASACRATRASRFWVGCAKQVLSSRAWLTPINRSSGKSSTLLHGVVGNRAQSSQGSCACACKHEVRRMNPELARRVAQLALECREIADEAICLAGV